MQVSLLYDNIDSFGYIPRNGKAESYGRSILHFHRQYTACQASLRISWAYKRNIRQVLFSGVYTLAVIDIN